MARPAIKPPTPSTSRTPPRGNSNSAPIRISPSASRKYSRKTSFIPLARPPRPLTPTPLPRSGGEGFVSLSPPKRGRGACKPVSPKRWGWVLHFFDHDSVPLDLDDLHPAA